jgi:cysteine desulfurase
LRPVFWCNLACAISVALLGYRKAYALPLSPVVDGKSAGAESPIYLDYNATTPIAREAAEAMVPFLFEHFGNPSSSHLFGLTTKHAVEAARSQVTSLLGCQISEVVFTSGGTESNNQAIKGIALSRRQQGQHIITSAIEHPAVTEVCAWLETQGFRITVLPVDTWGQVDPADLEKAITSDTLLVTIMHANNEVGTLQPIPDLAAIAHRHDALMHSDAAQSIGKIPVNVDDLGVDLLSLAGHKLYAPKGIGGLYIRSGVELPPLLHGAGHERGLRPGTENVLEIVGLGKACQVAQRDLEGNMTHFEAMRDRLHKGLGRELGAGTMRLNGHPTQRLPNTLSLSFRGVEANVLLAEIGDGVAASAGAACHAGEVNLSAVLEAMQVPVEWAMGTVRFSVGRDTSSEEIDMAVQVVARAVRALQAEDNSYGLYIDPLTSEDKGQRQVGP